MTIKRGAVVVFAMVFIAFIALLCWDIHYRYHSGYTSGVPVFYDEYGNKTRSQYVEHIVDLMQKFYMANGKYPETLYDLHTDTDLPRILRVLIHLAARYEYGLNYVAIYVSQDAQHYVYFPVDSRYIKKKPFIGGFTEQVPQECIREHLFWRNAEGDEVLLECFYDCWGSSIICDNRSFLGRIYWKIYAHMRRCRDNRSDSNAEEYEFLTECMQELLCIADKLEILVMRDDTDHSLRNDVMEILGNLRDLSSQAQDYYASGQTDLSVYTYMQNIIIDLQFQIDIFDNCMIPPDMVFRRL